METVKLFYNDPFLTEFSATVLSCEEGKGGYKVVLDQTAFYPEGRPAHRHRRAGRREGHRRP